MRYISTRGGSAVGGAEAIVKGLAPDGGLYVPESFPTVTAEELGAWRELDYPALAARVLERFLPEFGLERLQKITAASASRFSEEDVVPLVKIGDGAYFLELWHGPTHAFKDVALTTLPLLLTAAKEMLGIATETMILVATSGDTGKAALEGFKDVAGTRCAVLYPSEGVSELQRLQMTTQAGKNVRVFGIRGNFDDAQAAVKRIFTDETLRTELAARGVELSSANSINLGRLLPQVVYYFSAYFDLANAGEIEFGSKIDFCVPTGNFGDILAGYYAKRMGLPVGRLICASNRNNVLTDFLDDGVYTADRPFFKTISPSMDILVSSNLERLLFEAVGRDAARTAALMRALAAQKRYEISESEFASITETFIGYSATEEETEETIAEYFDNEGYLMDPHTAVAAHCLGQYEEETGSETPAVVLSTASPYKFAKDVLSSVGESTEGGIEACLARLEAISALEMPRTIAELPSLAIRFSEVLDAAEIADTIRSYAEEPYGER